MLLRRKRLLLAHVLVGAPAVAAAILGWPLWLGLSLLIPGIVAFTQVEQAANGRRRVAAFSRVDRRLVIVLVAIGIVVLAAAVKPPHRFAPLLLVGYFVLVIDPLWLGRAGHER
jgi:cell division protein FtsW (lipid II flippase)